MFGSLLSRDNETVPISITDWARQFRPGAQVAYNGNRYQAYQVNGSYTSGYYDNNAVVFSCTANRILLFSEARFQFQQLRSGRPGDLFGTTDLAMLEEPWPGHSTRDLLAQAELDITCAGNSYWIGDGPGLLRIDASKMKILTEGVLDGVSGEIVGERLLAYVVVDHGKPVAVYDPADVCHYMPYPDQTNRFLGRSWLSACIGDINADNDMTAHKSRALENRAELGLAVSLDKDVSPAQFDEFVERFRADHEGAQNAGKTLFLGGGADVKTVGQTFENLALKATQGSGETRIAACAGVPPVIVGLSEGLSSATYSNYSQARRRLVDGTMRPLWGFFASAMQSLVKTPTGSRLWYDDRDIPFLREDVKDQADVFAADSASLSTLVTGGFEPDAAVDAVLSGDLTRLKGKHTGLFSIQLQPPMTGQDANAPDNAQPMPAMNGASK